MTITVAQINTASDVLRSVLRFDYPADSVLSRYFRDFRELGARDRLSWPSRLWRGGAAPQAH